MLTMTTLVQRNLTWQSAPPQEKFTPVKYFSIDRVFRNETLDATHLAEFHQIEGVVADYGLTLGDLMGVLHQFFTKLGKPKLAHGAGFLTLSGGLWSLKYALKQWVF